MNDFLPQKGRNEIGSVQRPVVVGGVLLNSGDVIVADGDGVIVVPRAQAAFVAEMALGIMQNDKAARKALFETGNGKRFYRRMNISLLDEGCL